MRQRKEEKIQKNLSVKKPEFKDKSVELAVTSAPKLRQKNKIPEHFKTLSGKPVTSAPKLRQKNEIPEHLGALSEKPVTSAPKLRQKNEIPEHLGALSEKSVTSVKFEESKPSREASLSKRSITFAMRSENTIKKFYWIFSLQYQKDFFFSVFY